MKELVQLNLDGVTEVLPYRDYYRGRNGLVAMYIAAYLGLPYLSEEQETQVPESSRYMVPPTTQILAEVNHEEIINESDFYGLAVDSLGQVSKAILYKDVFGKLPGFCSSEFARSVHDYVLPGVVVFDESEIERGYQHLRGMGNFGVRLKKVDGSDGHDQYVVNNEVEARARLNEMKLGDISQTGVVMEANLNDARTISVGFTILGSDMFSFLALQKNDVAEEDGRDRYRGATIRTVRGDMSGLVGVARSESELRAIEECVAFSERYKSYEGVASRLSFDYLLGEDNNGSVFGGVTDLTGRLGGTCPGLVMSARRLKEMSSLQMVRSEVSLHYDPPADEFEDEQGATRFIDLPSLRLTARINGEE